MDRHVTIVLAEDNRGDVILFEEAFRLHALKYRLHVCRDGAAMMTNIDHVEAGSASCPDIILLDLNLPIHDGQEILERLRESAVCAGVPVMIVTSSDAPNDREQAARLGANYYFRKPSDYDQFMEVGQVVKDLLSAPKG